MGSSLSLSNCGGRAHESDTATDNTGGVADAASSQGGAVGGDPQLASGGARIDGIPAGGHASDAPSSLGGAAPTNGAGGSAGSTVPDANVLAQWTCSTFSCRSVSMEGRDYRGVRVDSTCSADPKRPSSADDCAADEWFECQLGAWHDGSLVAVNCSCAPRFGSVCMCGQEEAVGCGENWKVCSCAVTGILVK